MAGFLQPVLEARTLGPTEFGGASLIVGSVTLIFTIMDPRAREAVVRFRTEYRATGMINKALGSRRSHTRSIFSLPSSPFRLFTKHPARSIALDIIGGESTLRGFTHPCAVPPIRKRVQP